MPALIDGALHSATFEAFSHVRETSEPAPRRRPLDRVRDALRRRHYSRRTERAYVGWARSYVLFHGTRHPAEMGTDEVSRFLTFLAVIRAVQELLGHRDVTTTMIYTHVLNQGPNAVRSPLDRRIVASTAETESLLPQHGMRPVPRYLAAPRKLTRQGRPREG